MHVLLVRQPIFDQQQNVFAYEILHHTEQTVSADPSAPQPLAINTITDAPFLQGLNQITRGKKAFIRCGAPPIATLVEVRLPADTVVVEILDRVELDARFLETCKQLRAVGYQLALGEFALKLDPSHPIFDLADFFRIDLRKPEDANQILRLDRPAADRIKLLAHGVDTGEAFKLARDAGAAYFQGDFFCDPAFIASRDIPGYKLNHLRILNELHREDLDFAALEHVIKQDASLTYKLLNCVNSAFFGLRTTVSSVRHALTLLGEREIRKWASLVILGSLAQDRPTELLVTSLVRAHFCGSLATIVGLRAKAPELFLMGLLSLIDAIVGRPTPEIVQNMPLAEDLKTALLGGKNQFRDILDLALSYEKGDLERFLEQSFRFRLEEGLVTDAYLQAIELTDQALQLYGPRAT